MNAKCIVTTTAAIALATASAGATPDLTTQTSPRINVATNPVGYAFGLLGVSLSYAITDRVAVRADANHLAPTSLYAMALTGVTDKTYELGISVPIYLDRTYHGPFLEPGVMVRERVTDIEPIGHTSSPVAGPELLVGYHWTAASGLNLALAAGAVRLPELYVGPGEQPGPPEISYTTYLRVGYGF